jgi:hypothetical protein
LKYLSAEKIDHQIGLWCFTITIHPQFLAGHIEPGSSGPGLLVCILFPETKCNMKTQSNCISAHQVRQDRIFLNVRSMQQPGARGTDETLPCGPEDTRERHTAFGNDICTLTGAEERRSTFPYRTWLKRTGFRNTLIVTLLFVLCIPGVSAFSLNDFSSSPSGTLNSDVPVTVSFDVGVTSGTTFPCNDDIRLTTDLKNPTWTSQIFVNGVVNNVDTVSGQTLEEIGFLLCYSDKDDVSLHVTLEGNAPDSSGTFTLLSAREIDSNGAIIAGTAVSRTDSVSESNPVTATTSEIARETTATSTANVTTTVTTTTNPATTPTANTTVTATPTANVTATVTTTNTTATATATTKVNVTATANVTTTNTTTTSTVTVTTTPAVTTPVDTLATQRAPTETVEVTRKSTSVTTQITPWKTATPKGSPLPEPLVLAALGMGTIILMGKKKRLS